MSMAQGMAEIDRGLVMFFNDVNVGVSNKNGKSTYFTKKKKKKYNEIFSQFHIKPVS